MSEILTRTHNLLLNHSAEKRSSVDELELKIGEPAPAVSSASQA
jgi:hypothetical protein